MKFKEYGYREKKIEVREMTLPDIALTIAQTMIRRDCRDIEVRIIDLFNGEITTYKGLDEILMVNWSGDYKVNVYGWATMHDNVTNTDYLKVIIADDYYEEGYSIRIREA